ncbi:MAG TPA: DUF1501 domain-containing protein [Opitutaceae bacterium]|nr:DUF1501 domain-containing protein [Opitutaceae bacterium]
MNSKTQALDPNRRQFIGSCCAAVGATGMLSALAQLRLMGAIADPSNGPRIPSTGGALPADYKALVCLFLAGGNDANNLIAPNDTTGYGLYSAGRGALALPRTALLGLNPKTSDGYTYGLHPSMPEARDLFETGSLAVIANVGTLCVPTSKAQYVSNSVPLPRQLFSHNDQQVEWQSSVPDKPFATGWGGRLADLTNAFNTNNSISMSISLNGANSFQVGSQVVQYAVGTNGAISLTGSSTSATSVAGLRTRAQNDLLAAQNNNLFETAFAGLTANAVADSALLSSYLGGTAPFTTAFPNTGLGSQLRTIARLIAAAPSLGLKRQVFFARIGGWDLHDQQVQAGNTAAGAHANLLGDVSRSLAAFYAATKELGAEKQVTTFTASDFGRTFNTNGDGSDHGWGSHHLVMGGAVNGTNIYGRMPTWTTNGSGPDDTGRGRWIPSTSVDEYSATMAKWFGVSATNLPIVLPNIGRFAKPDLGFMA